ncbi:MAG: hypothetical protein C0391_02340 [Anaerolinea sp.]|nr:hypothetical protein [Anaerolinea sp.]
MQKTMGWLRSIAKNGYLPSIILWGGILFLVFSSLQTFFSAITPKGIGLTTDSVAYIWSAENLQNGLGLGRLTGSGAFKPMTHWPPLYSILIALIGKPGIDNYEVAKYIGAVLLALYILLLVIVTGKVSSSPIAVIGGAILLASPITWIVFLYALSEPLYLVLMLGGLLAFLRFLSLKRKIWLILSAFIVSLSIVTRYVGVAMLAAFILAFWLYDLKAWKCKLKDSILFLAISILPLALWLAYNQFAFHNATNRSLLYNPIPPADYSQLLETIKLMVKPITGFFDVGMRKVILSVAFLAWGGYLYLDAKRGKPVAETPYESSPVRFLIIFNIIHVCLYSVMVVISRLYFDPMIDIFRERIIYPAYLSLFILLVWCAGYLWRVTIRKGWFTTALSAILFAFLCVSFYQGFNQDTSYLVKKSIKDGIGIAAMRTDTHPIVKVFQGLPPSDLVYSDNIEVLYLLTGYPSYQLTDTSLDNFSLLVKQNAHKRTYYVIFRTRAFTKNVLELFPNIRLLYSAEDGKILEQFE